MSLLAEIAKRQSEFAFSLDQMASALDERHTLYARGHHTVEEQMHDAELLDIGTRSGVEVAKQLDQALEDLFTLKRYLTAAHKLVTASQTTNDQRPTTNPGGKA